MKWIKLILVSICIISLIYIIYISLQFYKYKNSSPALGADYMIVLGARVHGTEPSLSLQKRIEAAAQYLKKSPQTIAIVSGGQGPGEDETEAEIMKQELISLGIEETRILKEDQSTSTYENIEFSKPLLSKKNNRTVVVTNDYHLYRAILIGKQFDVTLEPLAAKTPAQALIKSYAREYLALIKYYLLSFTKQI